MNSDIINLLTFSSSAFLIIGFAFLLYALQDSFGSFFSRISSRIESKFNLDKLNEELTVKNLQDQCKDQKDKIDKQKNTLQKLKTDYIDEVVKTRTYYEEKYNVERLNQVTLAKSDGIVSPYYEAVPSKEDVVREVFDDLSDLIEANESQPIVKRALSDLEDIISNHEIKCALPYLVLLNVLDMYTQTELESFKDAFTYFIEYWGSEEGRRVLRNRFLSPQEKLFVINEEANVEHVDKNFNEFLLYMLSKHSYKEFRVIYSNFLKCFEARYSIWNVEVIASNSEILSEFEKAIKKQDGHFEVSSAINQKLIGGLQVKVENYTIDYSYQEIIKKNIENKGENNGRN